MPHRTATISPGGWRAGKHRPDMPIMLGILEVFVDSARKLRRPNPLVRRMDPWIKLSLGSESHATFIDKKGGRRPMFGQYFSFTVFAHTRILRIECFDKNRIGSDSLIGYGAVELDAYLRAENCGTQWFNLVHGGVHHAGQVQMHMAFYPKDASKLGKIHPPRLALTPVCVNWDVIVKQLQEDQERAVVAIATDDTVTKSNHEFDEATMDSSIPQIHVARCTSPVLNDSDSAIVSSRRNSTSSHLPPSSRRQPDADAPFNSTDMIESKLWQSAQALDSGIAPMAHVVAIRSSNPQSSRLDQSSRLFSDMDSVYSLTTDSNHATTNGFDRFKHEPAKLESLSSQQHA
ncbi:C2 domain-containing protein, partial [Catenaria anguillulae PL171]